MIRFFKVLFRVLGSMLLAGSLAQCGIFLTLRSWGMLPEGTSPLGLSGEAGLLEGFCGVLALGAAMLICAKAPK